MFDTHCHLNFKRFNSSFEETVARAHDAGVTEILIPGTDIQSSARAIELARRHDGLYAAVGIHPHHLFELSLSGRETEIEGLMRELRGLMDEAKVKAVGEVGIDKHAYSGTKYDSYKVTDAFVALQKQTLARQIELAVTKNRSIIFHNREAKTDLLEILSDWKGKLAGRAVFHCCEPDDDLLSFAKEHHVFIGMDGDVTYIEAKQEFIKHVPLDLLVLETDAPYLLPEPLRSQRKYPNEPAYLNRTAEYITHLVGIPLGDLARKTTENAHLLFGITRT